MPNQGFMSRLHFDANHASELRRRKSINLSHASDIESSAGLVERFSGAIGVSKKLRPAGAFLGNFVVVFLYKHLLLRGLPRMSHLAGNLHHGFLENDGRIEHRQGMAGHESPRTAKDEITSSWRSESVFDVYLAFRIFYYCFVWRYQSCAKTVRRRT
jgi:hypothetical protein